jgi:four helix bundle protein
MQFRDLMVWQRAMDLAELVYRVTRLLPPDERFGLVSQMRRSVRSIPANIAEGYGRGHTGDYCRFLGIAFGSLLVLETDLELASRLGMIPQSEVNSALSVASDVGRSLAALRRSLGSARGHRKKP